MERETVRSLLDTIERLAHEYADIIPELVHENLGRLDDLRAFVGALLPRLREEGVLEWPAPARRGEGRSLVDSDGTGHGVTDLHDPELDRLAPAEERLFGQPVGRVAYRKPDTALATLKA